jgi:hypothetical protein
VIAKKLRNQVNLATSNASQQLLGPNDRRYALVISAPATNTAWVSFGRTASSTNGLPIYAGTGWQVLLYDHIGQALREQINIITPAGADEVGCLDIFEEDCPCLENDQLLNPGPTLYKR